MSLIEVACESRAKNILTFGFNVGLAALYNIF